MEVIWFYTVLGFNHVLDIEGLDHFYFIIALCLPFGFKEFRKLLWWISLFTFGHTLSLFLNYYYEWILPADWIEFLIPVTIALSCIPLLIKIPNKIAKKRAVYSSFITLIFGLIHGLGFGRYFSLIVSEDEAMIDLFSFALGVEAAQICIVSALLLLNLFIDKFLNAKAKWQLILGAMILSQAITMLIQNNPF